MSAWGRDTSAFALHPLNITADDVLHIVGLGAATPGAARVKNQNERHP